MIFENVFRTRTKGDHSSGVFKPDRTPLLPEFDGLRDTIGVIE